MDACYIAVTGSIVCRYPGASNMAKASKTPFSCQSVVTTFTEITTAMHSPIYN